MTNLTKGLSAFAITGAIGAIVLLIWLDSRFWGPERAQVAAEQERRDRAEASAAASASRLAVELQDRALKEQQRLVAEERSRRVLVLSTMLKVQRLPALDGQCTGEGRPPYAWQIEGATFESNTFFAEDARCVSFTGPKVRNTTNVFCCPLPNTLEPRSL